MRSVAKNSFKIINRLTPKGELGTLERESSLILFYFYVTLNLNMNTVFLYYFFVLSLL